MVLGVCAGAEACRSLDFLKLGRPTSIFGLTSAYLLLWDLVRLVLEDFVLSVVLVLDLDSGLEVEDFEVEDFLGVYFFLSVVSRGVDVVPPVDGPATAASSGANSVVSVSEAWRVISSPDNWRAGISSVI